MLYIAITITITIHIYIYICIISCLQVSIYLIYLEYMRTWAHE